MADNAKLMTLVPGLKLGGLFLRSGLTRSWGAFVVGNAGNGMLVPDANMRGISKDLGRNSYYIPDSEYLDPRALRAHQMRVGEPVKMFVASKNADAQLEAGGDLQAVIQSGGFSMFTAVKGRVVKRFSRAQSADAAYDGERDLAYEVEFLDRNGAVCSKLTIPAAGTYSLPVVLDGFSVKHLTKDGGTVYYLSGKDGQKADSVPWEHKDFDDATLDKMRKMGMFISGAKAGALNLSGTAVDMNDLMGLMSAGTQSNDSAPDDGVPFGNAGASDGAVGGAEAAPAAFETVTAFDKAVGKWQEGVGAFDGVTEESGLTYFGKDVAFREPVETNAVNFNSEKFFGQVEGEGGFDFDPYVGGGSYKMADGSITGYLTTNLGYRLMRHYVAHPYLPNGAGVDGARDIPIRTSKDVRNYTAWSSGRLRSEKLGLGCNGLKSGDLDELLEACARAADGPAGDALVAEIMSRFGTFAKLSLRSSGFSAGKRQYKKANTPAPDALLGALKQEFGEVPAMVFNGYLDLTGAVPVLKEAEKEKDTSKIAFAEGWMGFTLGGQGWLPEYADAYSNGFAAGSAGQPYGDYSADGVASVMEAYVALMPYLMRTFDRDVTESAEPQLVWTPSSEYWEEIPPKKASRGITISKTYKCKQAPDLRCYTSVTPEHEKKERKAKEA